jgi:hypothetical protein
MSGSKGNKSYLPQKELRYLWQAIFLEKEMGKELG